MLRRIMCDTPLLLCLLTIFATIPANRCEECLETEEASTAEASDKTVSLKTKESSDVQSNHENECLETEESSDVQSNHENEGLETEESSDAKPNHEDDCLETEESSVRIPSGDDGFKTKEITPATRIDICCDLIDKINNFSNQLYYMLKEDKEKSHHNFVIAGTAIHMMLHFLASGAAGDTLKEINNVHYTIADELTQIEYLNLHEQLTQNKHLYFDNILRINKHIVVKDNFKNTKFIHVLSANEPISSNNKEKFVNQINNSFQEDTKMQTGDMISIDEVKPDFGIIALNFVLLQAEWKYSFIFSETYDGKFFSSSSKSVTVDMMHLVNLFSFKNVTELGASVVDIPFKDDKFSMLIVLPHGQKELEEVEEKLKNFKLEDLRNQLVEDCIELHLPKFEVENGIDVGSFLKKMGIETMFSSKANFKEISDSQLMVSLFKHQVYFEVNEMGTKKDAPYENPKFQYVKANDSFVFNVNRPFHYKIIYKTPKNKDLVILAGNIYNINKKD